MTPAIRLDLRPLYRQPLLHTRRAVQAHDALCHTIAGHDLRWGKGAVNTRLFLQPLGQLSIMALGYGAEVEIQAQPFDGFCLVQMPLRGTTEFYADDVHITTQAGEVAVLAPRMSERVLWQAGCEQLLVKVPLSLVHRAALDTNDEAFTAAGLQRLACAKKFPPELALAWQAMLQQWLAACTAQAHGLLTPGWLRHLESSAGLFLALHAAENTTNTGYKTGLGVLPEPHADRRWQRLLSVMQQHLSEPVQLEDLAAAVDLSPSALTRLCRRQRGVTPMAALRQMRLDAARQWLQQHPNRSVTEAALNYGFSHLGRFSAYYRERFGEMPSDTVARHGAAGYTPN